jgi:hypothetical protein
MNTPTHPYPPLPQPSNPFVLYVDTDYIHNS